VPLRNYSLTHSRTGFHFSKSDRSRIWPDLWVVRVSVIIKSLWPGGRHICAVQIARGSMCSVCGCKQDIIAAMFRQSDIKTCRQIMVFAWYIEQAGRRLVRSLLTICDIVVSLHPWPMWITELRITRYSAAYAKFERRTKLVISKLQCNTGSTDWKRLSICCLCWTETQSSTSAWALSYSAVKLFSKNSNLCDHGTWSLRMDRRTDGRHAIS